MVVWLLYRQKDLRFRATAPIKNKVLMYICNSSARVQAQADAGALEPANLDGELCLS